METLLMAYKALVRWISNYAAPVWSTNASESNIGKIHRGQNVALKTLCEVNAKNREFALPG